MDDEPLGKVWERVATNAGVAQHWMETHPKLIALPDKAEIIMRLGNYDAEKLEVVQLDTLVFEVYPGGREETVRAEKESLL